MNKSKALKAKFELEKQQLELSQKIKELELSTAMSIADAKSQLIISEMNEASSESSCISGEPNKRPNDSLSDHLHAVDERVEHSVIKTNAPAPRQPIAHTNEDPMKIMMNCIRRPSVEIKKFSGDPSEYHKFMRQFKIKIGMFCSNEDELMSYLEQFTYGQANKIITGYGHLDASIGFNAALRELEECFGSSEVLANAYIKRALNWPSIKPHDVRALDEYSIFLAECMNNVKGMTALSLLEYPDNIRTLVKKLPFHMHDRWRNLVWQNKENDRSVDLELSGHFVKREA